MERNVFFLDKNDAIEFQNKCVIAIFLEKHSKIKFIEYVGINSFLGLVDGIKTTIYLFDTPRKGSKAGVVFRTKNTVVLESPHKYEAFANGFIEEYKKYRNNVYEYILEHFFSCWKKYIGKIFISKEPENEMAYKYKRYNESEKNDNCDDSELSKHFKEFLDGGLVFSNPKTFNDPFDCDCDIQNLKSKIDLIWNAFVGLKYGDQGSINIKKRDIEKALEEAKDEKDVIDYIFRIIFPEESNTKIKTIEAVKGNYKKMLNQVQNLKERLRVLCISDKPNDILMWGYYCDGGNGVCCKYERRDIMKSVFLERKDCICLYGNVVYQNEKPQYNFKKKDLADNIFEYVIRCIFTKYSGWEHEHEFRFVLMEPEFDQDYVTVNSIVQEYYLGDKADNVSNVKKYIDSKVSPIKKVKKSLNKYEFYY